MDKTNQALIDPGKVKNFWERRGQKLREIPFESIANLEENPQLLALKTELEQACIMPLLPDRADATILDLGAGVGQWSFRFVDKATKVTAVEYSESLANIGRREAVRRGISNLEFVVQPAEQFTSATPFDIVFISGLFVYLTDEQSARLMANLPTLVKESSTIILRDGTSILPARHQIVDRHSDILNAK
jgi:cyclopropane fatty-acyl-phospholipid synthase-like methyltransferase